MLRRPLAFSRDTRGAIAPTLAILLPLVLLAAGGGIDVARVFTLKSQAQDASDAAVIAVAKYLAVTKQDRLPESKRDEIASKVFRDMLGPSIGTTFEVTATRDANSALTTLTAHSTMPTTFLKIVGMPTLSLTVKSTARFDLKTFASEIAFVLNTGASMNTGRKKKALDDALGAVLDKFDQVNKDSKNRVRVSMVPFQLGVAVPATDATNFTWNGGGTTAPSTCVTDRLPPYSHQGTPVTTWLPITKYPVADADKAPNDCGPSALIPITVDLASVKAALPQPSNVSGTNGAVGLAWGWNMLTPKAPLSTSGSIPLGKDQVSLKRVLIYMTDGENTGNVLGYPPTIVDDWSLLLCSGIKLAGISITTINIDGSGSEAFLKACASSPAKYKKVPAPDLPKILEEMTEEITGYTPIRLIK